MEPKIKLDEDGEPILCEYECQECGEMTPDIGVCFMCKETIIK